MLKAISSLFLGETDDSEQESLGESSDRSEEEEDVKKVKKNFRKIRRIVEDSSDEEASEEKAFSARTRLSITGSYPDDYNEESDNDSLILDNSDSEAEQANSEAAEIESSLCRESKKLEKMKTDLDVMNRLLNTKTSLPDKGVDLQRRFQELQMDIQTQQEVLNSFYKTNEPTENDADKDIVENSFEVLTSTFLDNSTIGSQTKGIVAISPIVNLTERRSIKDSSTYSASNVIDLSSDDEPILRPTGKDYLAIIQL